MFLFFYSILKTSRTVLVSVHSSHVCAQIHQVFHLERRKKNVEVAAMGSEMGDTLW